MSFGIPLESPRKLEVKDLERMCLPRALWGAREAVLPSEMRAVWTNYTRDVRQHMARGVSLFFWGPQGCGKSCLCALLATHVRSYGYTVYWLSTWDYREARRQGSRFDEETSVLERAKEVGLLILDGLSVEDIEDRYYGLADLRGLIGYRASHCRSTFVTTRLEFSQGQAVTTLLDGLSHAVAFALNGEDLSATGRQELGSALQRKENTP